ncbi:hypothetical protein BH09ACT8_BH09ACT8_61580 [soil metagenome]
MTSQSAQLERKSLSALIDTVTEATDAKPFGGFVAIASDASLDRDGEKLHQSEWKTPLPDRITVDSDHGMSVATTVGSARPFFSPDGKLMIDAKFSSIERAQEVRTLIREGHINTVSVAAMVDRSKKSGTQRRELLNVGIVAIPSNRNAVIVDSKAAKLFDAGLSAVLSGKSVADAIDPVEMTQAIHDASVHLGAQCVVPDVQDEDPTGEQDCANKALALEVEAKALALQLTLKAL